MTLALMLLSLLPFLVSLIDNRSDVLRAGCRSFCVVVTLSCQS